MGITEIDHLIIRAEDLQGTLDFYRRLGLETVTEERPGGASGREVIRINDAQKINVMPRSPAAESGSGGTAQPTMDLHLCLVWDGTIQEVLDLLASCGIEVESGPGTVSCARGMATSVFFRDPTGVRLELAVYD